MELRGIPVLVLRRKTGAGAGDSADRSGGAGERKAPLLASRHEPEFRRRRRRNGQHIVTAQASAQRRPCPTPPPFLHAVCSCPGCATGPFCVHACRQGCAQEQTHRRRLGGRFCERDTRRVGDAEGCTDEALYW